MKLKRYVLLDNNRIVDIEKLDGYLMFNIIKAIENEGEVATSDEVLELAVKGDLIEDELGEIVMVKGNAIEQGMIVLPGFLELVEYRFIYKLYKKIGKDYICVWEKEKLN